MNNNQQLVSHIIDGKNVASKVLEKLREEITEWHQCKKVQPKLAVLSVGSDPASQIYIKAKTRQCSKVGIASELSSFEEDASFEVIANKIKELNKDPNTHGILLQLPLPKALNAFDLLELIDPQKDVDGLSPYNAGLLASKVPGGMVPCTPLGCMELIKTTGITLKGCNALVIGSSNLVGRPLATLLSQQGATVTVATSAVRDLAKHVREADLLVSATGRAGLVQGDWIKPGAVIIDVGIVRETDEAGKSYIIGDVEFSKALERAKAITPVPGGVGPMTVAMLMSNVFLACQKQTSS